MPFLGKTPAQIVDPEVDIDGGTIDGATIGSITAGAGTFTNLSATGTITFPDDGISGDDINGGTISNVAISGTTASFSGDLTVDTNTLYVDSTNNRVGINDDTPSEELDITGDGSDVRVRLYDGAGASVGRIEHSGANFDISNTATSTATMTFTTGSGSGTTRMTISADGNVGIGGSPTMRLDVQGTAQDVARFTTSSTTSCKINIGDANTSANTYLQTLGDNFRYVNNNVERMRIDSSGNVGIGTTSPDSILDLEGATPTLTINDTATGTYSQVVYGGGNLVLSSDAGNTGGASTVIFKIDNSERMRLDSSGNLLVGKTSSSFSVAGIELRANNSVTITRSNADCLYINRTSSVSSASIVTFNINTTDAGGINATSGGTPSFRAASDLRLKDNVRDHESELANVMSLRPVRWDWKDERLSSGEGFVAQELEQTAWSDLVSEGDDGYKQVSGLGSVETRLIKAIQEQQTIIDSQASAIADLTTRLEALETN